MAKRSLNLLILSRSTELYSTQSLVYAARKRGHYVRVLDHMQCDLLVDENQLSVYYYGEEITDYDAVIPRIGTSATSYGSAVVRHFELMGVFSTLNHEALLRARDKISSLQLLSANGISVPKTVISDNAYSIQDTLYLLNEMPLIIKLSRGTQGIGVLLAEKKRQAEAILESFYKLKQQVLIQEFVEESKGSDIRILVVDGKVEGAMERKAMEGEFRSNLHRGGTSTIIEISKEEEQIAIKAAELMGLAVCGVDLLRSERGPLILEVNASPGLEGIETTVKKDIAGQIIAFCERNVK